ncbi:MAG: GNAT family N-acetyltransferase [Chloroflexi bacterium]|nr:GNAT family N-acetyltransferase [Chloroflexota bacterium]
MIENSPAYSWNMDDSPSNEDKMFLMDRINEYNLAATQIEFGGELMITLRDEGGQIVAGIYGWTWGGCLYVAQLWVREDLRHGGYGTKLLRAAEQEAIARGCALAALETHDFQAPEFYKKHGYEVVGVVEGYPRGHSQMLLKKRLA